MYTSAQGTAANSKGKKKKEEISKRNSKVLATSELEYHLQRSQYFVAGSEIIVPGKSDIL
jgi:hypothetical protein